MVPNRGVPLTSMAVKVLEGCRAHRVPGSDYVFPSVRSPRRDHIGDIRGRWELVKEAAGIRDPKGLRIHDLRHTFASALVQGGTSLFVARSSSATTPRR